MGLFFFFIWIGYSYRNLYMIKYLDLPYTYITILWNLSLFTQIIAVKKWGYFGDKHNWEKVFLYCLLFFCLEVLVFFFITKNTLLLLIPAHIFSGIANSGLFLAMYNIRYKYISKERKSVYEGFYGTIIGFSSIFSPLIANFLRNLLPMINNRFFSIVKSNFYFYFLFCLILFYLSIF